MLRSISYAAFIALIATTASAEGFQRIDDRSGFLTLVQDRDLKRLGVRLEVTNDGRIAGRAFGQKVTGEWRWDGGYFCRDIRVSGDSLGKNCQMVEIKGNVMRFTSDKGNGIYADLKLD